MKKRLIPIILLLPIASCTNDQTSKKNDKNDQIKKHPLALETEKERASFDKLPDHNDSVVGCWQIDKQRSVELAEGVDIDALFFLREHKKLIIFDSSENSESEEQIGFFRFFNNELIFEITSEDEPFQYVWKTIVNQGEIIAQNKEHPDKFLYLTKINRKSKL